MFSSALRSVKQGNWRGYQADVSVVTLATSLFLVLTANQSFWSLVFSAAHISVTHNLGFACAVFVFLVGAFTLIFSLFGFKHLFKPAMITLLLIAAVTGYFMDTYGVVIDRGMLQNAAQTDIRETDGLLSLALFWHVLWAGIIPACVVYLVPVRYPTFMRALLSRALTMVVALVVVLVALFSHYKDFSLVGRQHHELRYLINPTYPIYAFGQLVENGLYVRDKSIKPLGTDARLVAPVDATAKPKLVIFVLGETARAANFSLDGYQRDTNPLLARKKIINFNAATSCGTATAASLPCMFSHENRSSYDEFKAKHTQNLLDVLRHAGVQVLWRDNNSGCKGVCARVPTQDTTKLDVPAFCNSEECFDEILLYQLRDWLDKHAGNAFIVLHQHGSHGPEYYKRYPPAFNKFKPVCHSNRPQECSRQEIINAYDNTILYTDYFLSKVIEFLQAESPHYQTAMLYMSDHGESLGENGLYLHGFPYLIAPKEQKHVPFLLWLSPAMSKTEKIGITCMQATENHAVSHDNLFDTVLGMMRVRTQVYRPTQDLLAPCRAPNLKATHVVR